MCESRIESIDTFKIGDSVKFIDRTGAVSEPFTVIDVDEKYGILTAKRYENGRFWYSISAAAEHFLKA
jgi:hypothetical protein